MLRLLLLLIMIGGCLCIVSWTIALIAIVAVGVVGGCGTTKAGREGIMLYGGCRGCGGGQRRGDGGDG